MNKKISLQIDSCKNCMFLDDKMCIYPVIMVRGMPVAHSKKEIAGIPMDCPLCDATESDNIPAPIHYQINPDGNCKIVVKD